MITLPARFTKLVWEVGEVDGEHSHTFFPAPEIGYFPKMPVILQSNGLPWDIGNAYLVGQLEKPNLSHMRTLTARATHLKYFLQYLDDSGSHFLDLPQKYHDRVTQKFSAFMKHALDENDFSAEHINNIISTVAHFYTHIRYESLVAESYFENEPFTPVNKTISTTNRVGLVKNINVVTNDLRIRSSRRPSPELGQLRDGGSLRPLKLEEQIVIQEGFKKNLASIELELMMRIALETGARQQTVCTLSIGCVRYASQSLEGDSSLNIVTINAGHRYSADTKNGRLNRLIFSRELINDLMLYIECERAEKRRERDKSFYGDTDENYIFLTRDGNPYLTAQREIVDRQDPKAAWNITSPMMVPKNGQSLRNELKRFVQRIQKSNPSFNSFSFHDLRATMGMNIVRRMRAAGFPDTKVFDHVRQRLNHSDIKTTERYLNFDSELTEYNEIQEAFGEEICAGSINV